MQPTVPLTRTLAAAILLKAAAASLRAQDASAGDWSHFGLDVRMGFNMHANFKAGTGGAAALPPPPSAGSAVNRKYNDGFVNVDSSGNAGGQTWNWGYQNAGQVSGSSIAMHAGSGTSTASQSTDGDPNVGFEINYVRDLGHETWGRWGVKAAVGYTAVDIRSSAPLTATGEVITDTYQLAGVKAPPAPYTGSYGGPGPVLNSTPSRSVATGTTTFSGTRSLEGSLVYFRLGPTVELNLVKGLTLQAGGGLALGLVDSTFKFNDTTGSAETQDVGFQAGAYVEAGLAYRFWKRCSVVTEVQFQYLGDFNQSIAGHSAQLDLSQSVFVLFGFQVDF